MLNFTDFFVVRWRAAIAKDTLINMPPSKYFYSFIMSIINFTMFVYKIGPYLVLHSLHSFFKYIARSGVHMETGDEFFNLQPCCRLSKLGKLRDFVWIWGPDRSQLGYYATKNNQIDKFTNIIFM